MTYHPILEGAIKVVVGVDDHPKVAKGGNYAVDIATTRGQPIYAPADGKIPDIHADQLDGGMADGNFFTIDLNREKKGVGTAVRMVFAHLVSPAHGRTVVKAGDLIGHASGTFLHVGCNNRAALEALLS